MNRRAGTYRVDCICIRSSRSVASRSASGFSLLELIFVIVLVGLLAAIAGPRLFSASDFSSRGFFDSAINAARYAQKLALASGCNTRIQFTVSGYTLHQGTTCTSLNFTRVVNDPVDGAPFVGTAPSGVSVTAAEVYFDGAGRPREPSTGSLLNAPIDVNIGGGRGLRVEPESGYTHQL